MVEALAGDLPLVPEPYAELSSRVGMSEEELVSLVREWLSDGRIRRLGAVLAHQRVGVTQNVMFCIQVPAAQVEQIGTRLASLSEVSHCYEREVPPEFPYNVFAMVHAASKQAMDETLARLKEIARNLPSVELRTVKEYKKSSPPYSG